jgi:L-2,4-diaminobutyric acid acetyltransferase
MRISVTDHKTDDLHFRHPTIADGAAIWQLVIDAGTLDQNSSYLYLLLCRNFADSCAVAERDGKLVGFVTGFRSIEHPDVWFLWQIGVDPSARGQGLAGRLAHFVLDNLVPQGVRFLETTVTASNEASRALFAGIARRLNTELHESELFTTELFPGTDHEAEPLLRIGPFDSASVGE